MTYSLSKKGFPFHLKRLLARSKEHDRRTHSHSHFPNSRIAKMRIFTPHDQSCTARYRSIYPARVSWDSPSTTVVSTFCTSPRLMLVAPLGQVLKCVARMYVEIILMLRLITIPTSIRIFLTSSTRRCHPLVGLGLSKILTRAQKIALVSIPTSIRDLTSQATVPPLRRTGA